MIGFDFKAMKEGFFDREKVINAIAPATLKALKEFGRQIRKRAQKSLVYADDVSSPGSPPHAHKSQTITKKSKSTGKTRTRSVSFLREYIFFAFDKANESVVIGPARLNSTLAPQSLHALEYGGTSIVREKKTTRSMTVRARPFMRPALAADLHKLPPLWRNSIR